MPLTAPSSLAFSGFQLSKIILGVLASPPHTHTHIVVKRVKAQLRAGLIRSTGTAQALRSGSFRAGGKKLLRFRLWLWKLYSCTAFIGVFFPLTSIPDTASKAGQCLRRISRDPSGGGQFWFWLTNAIPYNTIMYYRGLLADRKNFKLRKTSKIDTNLR